MKKSSPNRGLPSVVGGIRNGNYANPVRIEQGAGRKNQSFASK
jgi:hypothetical protein